MAKRAAIYVRISDDRKGDEAGIRRQEVDCRKLAETRGWTVLQVLKENDVSAYSGKPRPAYRKLLAAIESGEIDAVIAWHPDRLHRQLRELEEFIDTVERHKTAVATVTAGSYDLSTPSGRFVARTLGNAARYESEHKAERNRRKHEELALRGEGKGGGTRPFGFKADRLTADPQEARHVKEAARRILAGESLRGLCADFNERGILTPLGNRWAQTTMKRMLISPRIAGLRIHRGQVVAQAVWKPIIDEGTHKRLVSILTDDRRRKNRAPRRYLLSGGLLRCALCGANLVSRPRGDGERCYICAKGVGFKGCGKLRQLSESLEDFVVDAVLTFVESPDLARAVEEIDDPSTDGDLSVQLADDRAALEELARDYYVDRVIGRAEFVAARDAIEGRLAENEQRYGGSTSDATVLQTLDAKTLRRKWSKLSLDQRRAVVAAVIEYVEVHPAVRGLNKFDAKRFRIVWRY